MSENSQEEVDSQRALLAAIVENIPVMLCIWDPKMERFEFNHEFTRVLGWTEQDTVAGDFLDKAYPDPEYRREVMAYMASLDRGWRDMETTARDGTVIPCSWSNITLPDGRAVGIGIDLRERKRAEEQLRRSERKYRQLFESIDEGFCIIEMLFEDGRPADYRFLETNPAFERHTGLRDAVGRTALEMVPGHEQHWFEAFGQVATTGRPVRFQNRAERMGRWYNAYAFPFGRPEDHEVAVLFSDITERKERAEELRRLNQTLEKRVEDRTAIANERARKLQEMAALLSQVEERERARVAEFLHDDLQQLLVAARLYLDRVRQLRGDPDRFAEVCGRTGELMQDCIEKCRELSHDLVPQVIAAGDFRTALHGVCEDMKARYGLNVTIDAPADETPVSQHLQGVLLRGIRELLFNVVKHAGVNEATVVVRRENTGLAVTVRDHGKGFDQEALSQAVTEKGLGLFGTRRRIGMLGGAVEIESAVGKGCQVLITVPVLDEDTSGQARPGPA